MLLGGVAWIGSHDLDPARPLPSKDPPLEVQVVSLDWKWLFIYPDQHVASVNQLVIPAGLPVHFSADLGERDERLLHPATRQHDLHDERHGDAAQPARRRTPARFSACPANYSGDGFSDMHFDVRGVAGGPLLCLGRRNAAAPVRR